MIEQIYSSQKIASVVSAGTTTLGASLIFDWIPNDIGKFASLVGIVLSLVLIYFHIRKGRIEQKKAKLELELLKKEKSLKQD